MLKWKSLRKIVWWHVRISMAIIVVCILGSCCCCLVIDQSDSKATCVRYCGRKTKETSSACLEFSDHATATNSTWRIGEVYGWKACIVPRSDMVRRRRFRVLGSADCTWTACQGFRTPVLWWWSATYFMSKEPLVCDTLLPTFMRCRRVLGAATRLHKLASHRLE